MVITHDGIAVKIYLNGSLESLTWANEDTKSVWWTALRTAKVNNFTIGCMPMLNDSSRGDEFDGQMTNIAFWNEEIDSDVEDLSIQQDSENSGFMPRLENEEINMQEQIGNLKKDPNHLKKLI